MSSDEIHYWLEVVANWQKQQLIPDTILQQTECLGELSRFLCLLKESLTKIGTIDEALNRFPKIGQLLGRLTTIVPVICDSNTYKNLMSCLMFFFVDEPATPVEAKAKNWVVSQVRSTVCVSGLGATTSSQKNTGFSQLQINSEYLKQTARQIHVHLRSGITSVPKDDLLHITRICLRFSHLPYFSHLLKDIIILLGEDDSSCGEEILGFISDNSNQTDSGQDESSIHLPYPCQLALWKHYLPSLEHSVLLLCAQCLEQSSLSACDMEEISLSSMLVGACTDDPVIYETVLSMLDRLRSEAGDQDTYNVMIQSLQKVVKNRRS